MDAYTSIKSCFQSNELAPTAENIEGSVHNNSFNRNWHILGFLRTLDLLDSPCSISIDGQWGSGKTFFVKQAIRFLELSNQTITPSEEQIDEIAYFNMLEMHHSYLPVYYDAWKYDNAGDPLLSILHTIATNPHIFKTDAFQKQVPFLQKAARFVDMFCDTGIAEFYKTKEEDDLFSELKSMQAFDQEVQTFMSECIHGKADRLVIFVDELDRCKPSFAVQLLERIKHYLSVENVLFVFSVNTTELVHTVKAVYGQGFDGYRYLDRFIDFRWELPPISNKDYLLTLRQKQRHPFVPIEVLDYCMTQYRLSIRETGKLHRALNASCVWVMEMENTPSGSTELLFARLIFPLMLTLKLMNREAYEDFLKGNAPEPFVTAAKALFQSCDEVREALELAFKDKNSRDLSTLYHAYFNADNHPNYLHDSTMLQAAFEFVLSYDYLEFLFPRDH